MFEIILNNYPIVVSWKSKIYKLLTDKPTISDDKVPAAAPQAATINKMYLKLV